MKEAIKDKWVSALLSGEYKQAKNTLNNGEGFCCLGVLCDLAAKEGIGEWNKTTFYDKKGGDIGGGVPTNEVVKWAGMKDYNPNVPYASPQSPETCLASMNDSGKYTFDDIAFVIEGTWEQL